ncbi:hypothetical protein ZWY2020_027666 [Hordeum vulgare]|nr:hypothetical protein ZWY2020_027666 [Hordeum vulgare]
MLRLGTSRGEAGITQCHTAVYEAGALDAMRLVGRRRRGHEHKAVVQLRELYLAAQLFQQVLHPERQRHGGVVCGHEEIR